MKKHIGFTSTKNYFENHIRKLFQKDPKFKPLVFCYHVTKRCNFSCSYCNYVKDGSLINHNDNTLSKAELVQLFKIFRKESSCIYLQGGEPFLSPNIMDILKICRELKFAVIAVNTNMSLMHKSMAALDYVTHLVASCDMVDDDEKYADILGVSASVVRMIKKNIIHCSKLQRQKQFALIINCVATKQGLPHIRDVIDFAFQNNGHISIIPEIPSDYSRNPDFLANPEYKALIEHVVALKQKGHAVMGSYQFLDTIYDFKDYRCFPFLNPYVYPNGDLFYPCLPLKMGKVNLLEVGSYKKALNWNIKNHNGQRPACRNKCYAGGNIELSKAMGSPLSFFQQ